MELVVIILGLIVLGLVIYVFFVLPKKFESPIVEESGYLVWKRDKKPDIAFGEEMTDDTRFVIKKQKKYYLKNKLK